MSGVPQIVIIGGGVTGLSAAHRLGLVTQPEALRITVLEADQRLGGKIRTEQVAGRALDVGAEALLARVPQAIALCRELGLGDELVAPATEHPFVWTRGRLRPLPPRMLAGLPDGAGTVAASGILSRAGMLRAGLDLWLPSRAPERDTSIGELVRRRLGREVFERLIDPLLGGIHGGSADELSVRATAPQLQAAMRSGHGLIRGLRSLAPSAPGAPAPPMFLSLRGGLGSLIDALRTSLAGAEIRTSAVVEAIERAGERARVRLADGEELTADHILIATPAYEAAEILRQACPDAAGELRAIEFASVATVVLQYRRSAIAAALQGSGFLVPRTEGRLMTACTWASAKWPQLAGDHLLLKASVGRFRDARALALGDEDLIDSVHRELAVAMDLREAPLHASVARFERGMAQYKVGHLELVQRVERALTQLPCVSIAGASYRGVGVGACVRDGEAAAERIASSLQPFGRPLAPVAP